MTNIQMLNMLHTQAKRLKVGFFTCQSRKNLLHLGNTQNSYPFAHFELTNFIADIDAIEQLRTELLGAKFRRKDNDLHSLQQTRDVSTFDKARYPKLLAFRHFLTTTVREWLEKLIDRALSADVALTG